MSTRTQTQQGFATAIANHAALQASDSICPGDNYINLARWLKEPFEAENRTAKPELTTGDSTEKTSFLSLYSLHPKGFDRAIAFASPKEFSQREFQPTDSNSKAAFLVFARGYPSPDWLNSIGSKLHLDPEYFQRHLDFKATVGRPNYHAIPSLPSSMSNTIRLVVTTIGSREVSSFLSDHVLLSRIHTSSTTKMLDYLQELRLGNRVNLGDSIVRKFHVLDETHFAVEQEISLCVERLGESWVGVAWLDIGKDLGQGLPGPWQDTGPRGVFYPTIQHWHRMALDAKSSQASCLTQKDTPSKYSQSAANLHLEYGSRLNAELAFYDSFYAFNKIFTFVAFAEVQFLNLLEIKITAETSQITLSSGTATLSNLKRFKDVLEAHVRILKGNLACIKTSGGSKWSKVPWSKSDLVALAESSRNTLLQDFTYLVEFAEGLSTRCDRGMDLVINSAMLAESKETYLQAQGMVRLTRLAFFYIPLSFTSGFFGMNFRELGNGSLRIWIWFVVAFVVTLLSLIISTKPLSDILVVLRKLRRPRPQIRYATNV